MNERKRILFGAVAATAFFAAQSGAALAQATPAQVASSSSTTKATSNTQELEEVVVVARRSEESQQKVPVAVTTVSTEALTTATVSGSADIQRLVPSLQIYQGFTGQTDYLIRGSFQGFGSDPSVITYQDEVPLDPRTLEYATFDLSSVQQLKGPQGTLFGKNGIGGAVLFLSQKPILNDSGGYLAARYGNYNERRLEGAINIPAGDTLAFRVAAEYERRDGTIESITVPGLDFNDRNNWAIRGSALWAPSDSFENYTQITVYRVTESRTPLQPISIAGPCTSPFTPALSCVYTPPFNGFFGADNLKGYVTQQLAAGYSKTTQNTKSYDNVSRDSVTNTFTLNLGALNVRNTTYYGKNKILFGQDWDGTPANVFQATIKNHDKTFYNETQAYGKVLNDRLDWRLGAVYSDTEESGLSEGSTFAVLSPTSSPSAQTTKTDFKSYAVFGQATYDLSDWIHGLSLTAGYRNTWDDRTLTAQNYGGSPVSLCQFQILPATNPPSYYPNTDPATCTRRLTLKSNSYNYNFTASWQATDRILLYAATRRGYVAGSFNKIAPPNQPDLNTYAPEIVEDVELGLKSEWRVAGIPVRANIAAFDSWYTDIQVSQTIIDPVTGRVSIVVENRNKATGLSNKAEIYGFEAEGSAIPLSWLTLSAFYSHVWATYSQFITSSGQNLEGQNVYGVIPKTWGVTAKAKLPITGPFEGLNLTGSYYVASPGLTNITLSEIAPKVSSFDGRLEATNVFGSNANVALYAKNIGKESSCLVNIVTSGEPTRRCGEPRTYGVELRYKFGGGR